MSNHNPQDPTSNSADDSSLDAPDWMRSLYAEGNQERPPQHIDQFILGAAAAKKIDPPATGIHRWQKWGASIATAAVVVLSVGIFYDYQDVDQQHSTQQPAFKKQLQERLDRGTTMAPTAESEAGLFDDTITRQQNAVNHAKPVQDSLRKRIPTASADQVDEDSNKTEAMPQPKRALALTQDSAPSTRTVTNSSCNTPYEFAVGVTSISQQDDGHFTFSRDNENYQLECLEGGWVERRQPPVGIAETE